MYDYGDAKWLGLIRVYMLGSSSVEYYCWSYWYRQSVIWLKKLWCLLIDILICRFTHTCLETLLRILMDQVFNARKYGTMVEGEPLRPRPIGWLLAEMFIYAKIFINDWLASLQGSASVMIVRCCLCIYFANQITELRYLLPLYKFHWSTDWIKRTTATYTVMSGKHFWLHAKKATYWLTTC